MKRKSRKERDFYDVRKAQPYDLFGEIPVTHDKIRQWVTAVSPRWLEPERSYQRYVKSWNVVDKIRHAKAQGTFYATIENPLPPFHGRIDFLCFRR